MRGVKVFKGLFDDQPTLQPEEAVESRGRNAELIQQRNEHLLYRFVWYGRDNYRYEYIVKQLCEEFYLSERTVSQIITDHAADLQKIRQQNPTVDWLRKKYQNFKW